MHLVQKAANPRGVNFQPASWAEWPRKTPARPASQRVLCPVETYPNWTATGHIPKHVGKTVWTAGIHTQTYYRWRKEYGGLKVEQAKRLKALERENTRLKRLVAELSLEKQVLKDVAEGKF